MSNRYEIGATIHTINFYKDLFEVGDIVKIDGKVHLVTDIPSTTTLTIKKYPWWKRIIDRAWAFVWRCWVNIRK